jgi:hypothetical protein
LLAVEIGCSTPAVSNLSGNADAPQWARQLDKGRWDYFGQIDARSNSPTETRVKFHDSYISNKWMVVKGTTNAGREYPVVLDTGASQTIFIDRKHVRDNRFSVYHVPAESVDDLQGWGLCNVDSLKIGSVTLSDWPAFYRKTNSLSRLLSFGNPTYEAVIIGLPVLREFSYIIFDGIRQEVEFALAGEFKFDNPQAWKTYTFTIEEDFSGNAFLFFEVSIASVPIELQLDTGSGRGLALSESMWDEINENIEGIKLRRASEYYPFMGNLPCRKGRAKKLEFGGSVVVDADISVFADDSPLVADCDGMVGMSFFKDVVLVLDFEKELLRVRRD